MAGMGPSELTILLMLLGGFGLPLGVPPQPENPAMQYVAPAECAMYATWSGMGTPLANSGNHTDQLFAEPEVQAFGRSLDQQLTAMFQNFARESGDPKGEQMAKVAPVWIKAVITRSAAMFATKVETDGKRLVFEGGLLVEAGDQSAALADGLVAMLTTPENKPVPGMLGTTKVSRFAPQKGMLESEIAVAAAGPYVLVGVGKGSVEGMIARIRAKQVPAWFTAAATRLPVPRRSSLSYVNTKSLVASFLPLAGPEGQQIAKSLGLEHIGEYVTASGLNDQGIITRSFVKIEGEPAGLVALIDTKGIKPEQVSFLPKDATIASAFTLNLEQAYNLAAHLTSQNSPEGADALEQMSRQFRETFRLRLQEDLLASLGEVWTLSLSPADGLLGATATVELRDRTKLDTVLQHLTAMLGDVPPDEPGPRLQVIEFNGQKIQQLKFPGMPFGAAWCVTADRLILSASVQGVKSQLSGRPAEIGLLDDPKFAKAFAADGRIIAIGYQDSARVFESTYSYLTMFAPLLLDSMNEPNFDGRPRPSGLPLDLSTLPSARSIHRHLRPSLTVTRRTADGIETESEQTMPSLNLGTTAPIAVALLLPAVQSARSAAQRMQSSNNLKQQMLALHNYHDTFTKFPAAYSVSKERKPLLSWRVQILPFIEQSQLYDQFKQDEPWDSEHNKALIDKMPDVFRSPKSTADKGKTTYHAIGGPDGTFRAPGGEGEERNGISFASMTDGTSNTIAIVEGNDSTAVIWTKPEEFVPNEKEPLKAVLGLYPGGFNAALGDGSVRFISDKIDAANLNRLYKKSDGEVAEIPN